MKFAESIFKAYDIRGLVGTELTSEVAYGVGRALADFVDEGPIGVGYDMRPDSAELAEQVRAGLVQQGREVWDIGQVTSDMIYFAVGNNKLAAGAMVTASHNPGAYNGIKLCRELARPIGIDTGLVEIKNALINDSYKDGAKAGSISKHEVIEDWVKHSLSFVHADTWPAYQVAVDAGNGMAGAIVPTLEKFVPLKVTEMYFELDGTFPNHPASPIEVENLADIIAKIKENNLDFGIAFDGDGDRAFLIDELGRQVSGSVMTSMLAEYFLGKFPGSTILYNVICSRVVAETIKAHGGTGVRTKVGHSYIKADMQKYGASFAGEHSGHYYFKDNFNADSGLIAALVGIQVLVQSGGKLSELVDKYSKYCDSGEINSTVTDTKAKLAELTEAYKDGKQDTLDGLTVNYEDWWFNVRPSNTEPLLRLNVEATTPELLKQKTDEVLALIRTS
jgi:phosphomannomutase